MRFSTSAALILGLAASSAYGIQNIFVGQRNGCGTDKYGPNWYVWFTDAPTCTSGTNAGPTKYFGNSLCSKDLTILGHTGVRFTGCKAPTPGTNEPWGPPTGVSDGGNPALTCHAQTADTKCPSACGSSNPDDTVKTLLRCV